MLFASWRRIMSTIIHVDGLRVATNKEDTVYPRLYCTTSPTSIYLARNGDYGV
jgi:hypothetical protein